MDPSILVRLPAARLVAMGVLSVALAEEVLFRGLVQHGFMRMWARGGRGAIASVGLTAALFAVLHGTQVFTFGVSRAEALLLVLQTLIIATWWGALVVLGGSVWPAVVLHFVGNALVALQGLVASPVGGLAAYQRHLWLSLPLAVLGIWLLARAVSGQAAPGEPRRRELDGAVGQ